ncbi:hypothetical protein C8K36_101311 [Rhodococcus sp. OK519]|uniref:hypothetical protein n=1 Tax=Rhodococcus sp. OK519 TaxID=2135729 RepID=UPI000D3D378C|nr:hypothetical protein C8K36_101311 [Rhodococcus sp. OK519]
MNHRARNLLSRSAIGLAAAATVGLAAPGLAGATPAVKAPSVKASVTGNTIAVTVQNTNTDSTVKCGAAVVLASKVGELEADPSKLFTPGFAAYRTPPSERVAASSTATFTTPDLNNGVYAALAECASTANPADAAVSKAQVVTLPGDAFLGSLQNGAFENIIDFITTGAFDSLIDALAAGSSQPAP